MKRSIRTGVGFGLTSGIITTLGLIVGLSASTHSRIAVIGGILTIAIADSFADALGIHVAEEADMDNSDRQVWESTLAAFFTKAIFAGIFLIPFLFFSLSQGVIINIFLGLLILFCFSFYLGIKQKENGWKAAFENLIVGMLVITVSAFAGSWISKILQ